MRVKNSRYDFRVNLDTKEKFKVYCKIMGVSPSDILSNVLEEFNDNFEKIANMQDIKEVRALVQDKMNYVNNEIQQYGNNQINDK